MYFHWLPFQNCRQVLFGSPIFKLASRFAAPMILALIGAPDASAQLYMGRSVCDEVGGCQPNCAGCQSFAQQYGCTIEGGMPGMAPPTAEEGAVGEGMPMAETPMADLGPTTGQAAAPSFNTLAGMSSGLGAASGVGSIAPSTIGDFFGGGFRYGVAFNRCSSIVATRRG